MTLTPGSRLGPYEIVSAIGAGGMGEVYRARDSKLDRHVAIKVLPAQLAENAAALARFEREAKAVAALSHPNILAIFDFGHDATTVYAVMELLDGETLRQKLAAPVPVRKAVEYGVQIARGLAAAQLADDPNVYAYALNRRLSRLFLVQGAR
jgi:serine/threonine protein kinase